MSASATKLSLDLYNSSLARVRAATPAISLSLERAACEATASNLKGRVVLVTGAGSGFGRAFSIAAAKFGAKVFISDLSVASAQETADLAGKDAEITVYPSSCDVSSWEAQLLMFKYAKKTMGPLHVVVPNAGVGECGELLNDRNLTSDGDPIKPNLLTLDVNLVGVIYTTRLGMFYLRENHKARGRSMVFLGSLASISGLPSGPMYGAAKHGVLGLFRSVYYNGLADGINMNVICPWFVDTKIIAPLTRIGLFGLPLAAIEDVVGGMLRSASDPDFNGNTIVIDADGILAIPFEQFSSGESGYFHEFEKRASTSITTERKIKDLGLIVRQVSYYWVALVSSLLFGLFATSKAKKA